MVPLVLPLQMYMQLSFGAFMRQLIFMFIANSETFLPLIYIQKTTNCQDGLVFTSNVKATYLINK